MQNTKKGGEGWETKQGSAPPPLPLLPSHNREKLSENSLILKFLKTALSFYEENRVLLSFPYERVKVLTGHLREFVHEIAHKYIAKFGGCGRMHEKCVADHLKCVVLRYPLDEELQELA